MIIIIVLIVIIISFKYYFFIIFSIPLKLWIKSRIKKIENKQIENKQIENKQTNRRLKKSITPIIGNFFLSYYRYSIINIGQIPSHMIRNFFYKYIYSIKLEKDAVIYYGAEIRGSWNLNVGAGSIIGDKAILDARCGINIGSNVNISSNVSMWTEQHDYNDPYFNVTEYKHGPINIGNRVWIGPNVTILHNVTIEDGAVVAAGAVVTKNVDAYSVVGGIPAKKIGERSKDLRYNFYSKNRAWFY